MSLYRVNKVNKYILHSMLFTRLCVCVAVDIAMCIFQHFCATACLRVCVYIISWSLCIVGHILIVCIHIQVQPCASALTVCVLTCMWKQGGLIFPRGVFSEGCAACFCSTPFKAPHVVLSGILPMTFMGHSWVPNEQNDTNSRCCYS